MGEKFIKRSFMTCIVIIIRTLGSSRVMWTCRKCEEDRKFLQNVNGLRSGAVG